MAWKQAMTPIARVTAIDPHTRSKLVEHHITTAEELVGQVEASPGAVARMLEIDEPQVRRIAGHARAALDPATLRALDGQRGRAYRLGALPPEGGKAGA